MDAREQIQKRLENALATLRRELESQGIDVNLISATYTAGYEAGTVQVQEQGFTLLPPPPPMPEEAAVVEDATLTVAEEVPIVLDEPKPSKRKPKSDE